jgi:hypothetical protein
MTDCFFGGSLDMAAAEDRTIKGLRGDGGMRRDGMDERRVDGREKFLYEVGKGVEMDTALKMALGGLGRPGE